MPEPDAGEASRPTPGLLDLVLAFGGIAVMGFGGVLPWARRMLVEQRRWLTPDEFTEVLSLGQFLPGGNIVNIAVVVGQRYRGPLGAAVSVVALFATPFVVVLLLGGLYLRYSDIPRVHGALAGLAAAAVGLIFSLFAKMAEPLVLHRAPLPILFAVMTFVAVGLLRVPLPLAVAVLAPLSIVLALRRPS